ncbi:MAG: SAM-dependent methyltransferase, partial [Desulfatiglandales bacterium]
MRGRLYVIGVGPGDPELITLKAKRILESVRFIFFPKGHEEGHSLARAVVEPIVDLTEKDVVELHFPMLKRGERDSEERLRAK